jgi:tetratricopeptide (TPR) repeat protein
VLDASGIAAHPDQLASALYIPERRGTLQVELMAAARRQGRLAVELEGDLEIIVRQLQAGRPVLVLQNLGVSYLPVWHYAVVVGYQPDRDRFVLRSGRERRELTSRGRFQATLQRGGNWALVVLAPDAEPVGIAPEAYLEAAADLENTGAHQHALAAFRSAQRRWPAQPLARLGEANNLYYLGRHDQAADAYRRLLANHPDHVVAVHNLAMLLLELRRPCQAQAVVAAAASLDGALMDTARRAVADVAAESCPAG